MSRKRLRQLKKEEEDLERIPEDSILPPPVGKPDKRLLHRFDCANMHAKMIIGRCERMPYVQFKESLCQNYINKLEHKKHETETVFQLRRYLSLLQAQRLQKERDS